MDHTRPPNPKERAGARKEPNPPRLRLGNFSANKALPLAPRCGSSHCAPHPSARVFFYTPATHESAKKNAMKLLYIFDLFYPPPGHIRWWRLPKYGTPKTLSQARRLPRPSNPDRKLIMVPRP